MKRLLLYIHFNKYHDISEHVLYQLEQLRPLFEHVLVISNSPLSLDNQSRLLEAHLADDFLQRENSGYDFAAWRDGMKRVGFERLQDYDSVTIMNDTCFGPLYDLSSTYQRFETNEAVDFWGMTNFRETERFKEHIQSYFMSFSRKVVRSEVFQVFWQSVQDFTDVQDVIDHYETRVTTVLLDSGFKYGAVFDTTQEDVTGMLHPDFSYYHPTAILHKRVPFIKVKTVDANQHIMPYILSAIERETAYPVDLIVRHMSMIGHPDSKYLLARKYLQPRAITQPILGRVAVHLHVFYTDLLEEFLRAFESFAFAYDLWITTDNQAKQVDIEAILADYGRSAQIRLTGNIGRDVLPMLRLKKELETYDYVGHFHTKKSKEADFWAGESWRTELIDMLIKPANNILQTLEQEPELGIVIADIPSFFRYNKIVDAWNEHNIAPEMNRLWKEMGCQKEIDFQAMHTFVMSYGTFVWFKYDALRPLFDLELKEADVPAEPLPQNSVLHAIERLLVYIAWDRQYDFRIAKNPIELTPFIDNKLLNERDDIPRTSINFDHIGGLRGALKYIIVGPTLAVKYIIRRLIQKLKR
ncbi:rhamnan synthesis F family protein [Streptococcus ovuberis]|uniref:Alpha-L-Rha alpha-1,3-L-rhamnosyltransferase n=1 Tax=Streptococcus ovuberis TaxID=1936207 RepID=A0A7X6RZT4_9STRE|nr:rhamnan synthesis F family protein [Streptococcus ovuberis]NKZ19369.1 alpha-L-Rha alpha-1,3-L-rhamnosyltransferase [Streptococcus ovuberis]